MSFMLALPKISLHGAGAIADMVNLVANKQWGKALIVTDGQLVKLGLLDSLFSALDEHQMSYHLFDEVFPNRQKSWCRKVLRHIRAQNVTTLSPSAAAARSIPQKR
ncbi:Lactaldehyde reductase [Salmonella enterica subsp. enterica]|uniref:Lactaldehyde reductase n=1 Tax=Salmonella enterica I TaxID=59201 RepID=A0A379WHC5_SALET|nr:Lactaldehyde reductase [Salmonella enterica subsp. enterica]